MGSKRITTEQRVLDFLALYDRDEVAFTLESLTELLLAAEKAAVSEADADWRAVIEEVRANPYQRSDFAKSICIATCDTILAAYRAAPETGGGK